MFVFPRYDNDRVKFENNLIIRKHDVQKCFFFLLNMNNDRIKFENDLITKSRYSISTPFASRSNGKLGLLLCNNKLMVLIKILM